MQNRNIAQAKAIERKNKERLLKKYRSIERYHSQTFEEQ